MTSSRICNGDLRLARCLCAVMTVNFFQRFKPKFHNVLPKSHMTREPIVRMTMNYFQHTVCSKTTTLAKISSSDLIGRFVSASFLKGYYYCGFIHFRIRFIKAKLIVFGHFTCWSDGLFLFKWVVLGQKKL